MPTTTFIYIWIAIAVITFFYLIFIKTAPYGRHVEKGWGPTISNRLGWIFMEAPALILFFVFFFRQKPTLTIPTLIFISLWFIHYFNRSFIYPLRIKSGSKRMPLFIMLSAILFNSINTWIVGNHIGFASASYTINWLSTPQFIIGLFLFVFGFIMNQWADHTLMHLRKPGETDYKIPQGILFSRISSPNLLGEMIEWIGFFVMTWSLPTATFAIWTIANLLPRALAHHKWYLDKFPDYPKKRKALGFL